MWTDDGDGEATGGSVYDWWSRHPRALDALYALAFLGRERGFRERALDALDPKPGERVLEVGPGTGRALAPIREAVGAGGAVVGIDASGGMTRSARDRIRDAGWRNVHVVRGDARRLPVAGGAFDAAYAAMSLSAVREPERAIEAVGAALRPGGRFVVLDAQPFQEWPWRAANPIVVPVSRRATDWVPEADLPAALRREFDAVDVSTFNAGTVLLACARKHAG